MCSNPTDYSLPMKNKKKKETKLNSKTKITNLTFYTWFNLCLFVQLNQINEISNCLIDSNRVYLKFRDNQDSKV